MPAVWVNTSAPTMGVLAATHLPEKFSTMRLIWAIRVSSMDRLMPILSLSTTATSASEALPARSPNPLMVHST